jgi:penicillin amidase
LQQLATPSSDVFGANPAASRDQLMLDTLEEAWSEAQQLMGPDPKQWYWGKLHSMRFRHELDHVPGAAQLLDLGPIPRPGDGTTVNATSFAADSWEQEDGASYREILDTGDWDRSLAVNTPGQSGQPLSEHYSDLLPLWDRGEYFQLIYSRERIEREVRDRLVLTPK